MVLQGQRRPRLTWSLREGSLIRFVFVSPEVKCSEADFGFTNNHPHTIHMQVVNWLLRFTCGDAECLG